MVIYYSCHFFLLKNKSYFHLKFKNIIFNIKCLNNIYIAVAWLLLYKYTNNDYYIVVPQYATVINNQ